MTVRHLDRLGLDPEQWYVIECDRDEERDPRPKWQHRSVSLHGPNVEARAEWNILRGNKFGLGFRLGRNGGESDLGLDVYLGRLAAVWLRLRTPWTKWAQISQEKDPDSWYWPRHTGIRLFPFKGRWLEINVEERDGISRRDRPWWHEISLGPRQVFGLSKTTDEVIASGTVQIPMPEGNYGATYETKHYVTRYTKPVGRLRDIVFGPRAHVGVWLEVEGGIPCEGKGEDSWNCGMDGIFGAGGKSINDAIGRYVSAVLRERERNGGPHDLPYPMTVQEADR